MRLCSGEAGPNTCWNLNECLIVKESTAGNFTTTHYRLHYKQNTQQHYNNLNIMLT